MHREVVPPLNELVFFKLQLVMFFEGIRSERELMRQAADRLSVLWYLGYNLDEPLPDHSSLTRIRTRDASRSVSSLLRDGGRSVKASRTCVGKRAIC